jgi:hypothetical protein
MFLGLSLPAFVSGLYLSKFRQFLYCSLYKLRVMDRLPNRDTRCDPRMGRAAVCVLRVSGSNSFWAVAWLKLTGMVSFIHQLCLHFW